MLSHFKTLTALATIALNCHDKNILWAQLGEKGPLLK